MFAVGLCVDRRYLVPATAVLVSLAEATLERDRAAIAVRVLTSDLARSQASSLAAAVRYLGFGSFTIRWDKPSTGWRLTGDSYISATTYLRFHFDERFVGRPYLVYLDSDTLVLGDITAPFDRITGGRMGLVRDLFNHTVGVGPALPGVARRWPRFASRPYYNAGAMWCETALLRTLRCDVEIIMDRASEHIYLNDQDALNLWALHRHTAAALDMSFNTFETDRFREIGDWIVPVLERVSPPAAPALLHFVGEEKPWLRTCPPTPGATLYRRFHAQAARLLRTTPIVTPRSGPSPSPGRCPGR